MSVQTPEQFAQAKFAKLIADGYALTIHTYHDLSGEPVYWRARLKHPDGKKQIRPFRKSDAGYVLGEPVAPESGKLLYGLEHLASAAEVVFIVEGENKVDALVTLGLCAVTSGGANSDGAADWTPLAGRHVRLWPDYDKVGFEYVGRVASALAKLNCVITTIDLDAMNLPKKGDVIDWIEANPNATASDILALPMPALSDESGVDGTVDNSEKQSQATKVVALVRGECHLLHDESKNAYAEIKASGVAMALNSRTFRDWLTASYYGATAQSLRKQSVSEAIDTLSGLARAEGDPATTHLRCGLADGKYYVDLCEPNTARAVEVSAGVWKVVDRPPVKFVRTENMQPLPVPVAGGHINDLWPLVNIPQDCRLLTLAWLCESLRPDTPYPVLELIGEQGCGKSSTQTLLRQLIDPNACDLRAAPKTADDVYVAANVSHLISYENLSHLPAAMQDAFCTISTGGGYAKRTLYTDAEESVLVLKRPLVLNGISVCVTQQDLTDRTVSLDLPVIADRGEERELKERFKQAQPRLFGALLTLFAKSLATLPAVQISTEDRPRLIEFAKLGIAIERVTGAPLGEFMRQFKARRSEAIARTLDASPVAVCLVDWFNEQGGKDREITAKALLEELNRRKPVNTDIWPRSPRGLGDALRRAAPALREMGINCKQSGNRGGNIYWSITSKQQLNSPKQHHECHASHGEALRPDTPSMTFMTSMTLNPQVLLDDVERI
jgi:hypothetical protein